MPLCWSHAEYLSLVRSAHDDICFDRVAPAYERYVTNPIESRHEIWNFRHQLRQIARGKTLRLIIEQDATIIWTADAWANTNRMPAAENRTPNLWFADLPTENCSARSRIEFTFVCTEAQRWEGKDFSTMIVERT
jgi:glucoamylase